MTIWSLVPSIEQLNEAHRSTLVSNLGIDIVEIGENYITARMPVDERTIQPFGLLHGGASMALAETLGSVAANLVLGIGSRVAVGMEINANHIRPVKSGFVIGIAVAIHIGSLSQVWEVKIFDRDDKLVCVSRMTLAIVNRP